MAKKTAKKAAKKAAAKPAPKCAKITPARSKPRGKSEVYSTIAEHVGISRKEVAGVFDVVSLLYGQPIAQSLRVSKTAPLECLCLSKGHFFTLINECPGVLLNLLKPESRDCGCGNGVIR